MNPDLDVALDQRGRASVNFLLHLSRGASDVAANVEKDIQRIVPDPDKLPDDLDQRTARMAQSLSASRPWRTQQLVHEWHASMHGVIAAEAFDEVRDRIDTVIRKYQDGGPATLEPAPEGTIAPAYWEGVNFHRTAGGWDEHEHQGYVHGEIVHKKLVDAAFPGGGIFKQRRLVAAMAPRDHYDRILDMGASTGHFTAALQETYPGSQIVGVDLSLKTLQHAQRVANANGWAWQLYQRPAEATGFAGESFDLVASYILLHELPAATIRGVFTEALRVLKPGGDMIMSDVTRYADLDKLSVWRADSGARYGGEPHWRESASLDLGEVARTAGFVDVTVAASKYPHVVQGRKPA
jgi:SAM-dependent methyltransferase